MAAILLLGGMLVAVPVSTEGSHRLSASRETGQAVVDPHVVKGSSRAGEGLVGTGSLQGAKGGNVTTRVPGPAPLFSADGYAEGTTGGTTIVQVTSAADSGGGSLREALAAPGRHVVFARDMIIALVAPLHLPSNTTLDGRDRAVTIDGQLKIPCVILAGVSNIILESLTVTRCGNPALTSSNTTPDAILLDGAHGVWLDHGDLSHSGDKAVAVQNGSTRVTVSWTHFHDQEQTFQIGDYDGREIDGGQTVSVHHNYFDHTGYRNPVISYGSVHVYDNFYLGWKNYGVQSERVARVLVQNNIFRAEGKKKATMVGAGPAHKDPRLGYLRASGNLLEGSATMETHEPGLVPSPPYDFLLQPATDALAGQIATEAGPA